MFLNGKFDVGFMVFLKICINNIVYQKYLNKYLDIEWKRIFYNIFCFYKVDVYFFFMGIVYKQFGDEIILVFLSEKFLNFFYLVIN